jgi:hypothetical protein
MARLRFTRVNALCQYFYAFAHVIQRTRTRRIQSRRRVRSRHLPPHRSLKTKAVYNAKQHRHPQPATAIKGTPCLLAAHHHVRFTNRSLSTNTLAATGFKSATMPRSCASSRCCSSCGCDRPSCRMRLHMAAGSVCFVASSK